MKRPMPDFIKFPLALVTVCVISAAVLTALRVITLPAERAQAARQTDSALRVAFPEADSFELKQADIDGRTFEYRIARKGARELGYVAEGSATGYSSVIRVMVGLDRAFEIMGVEVLYQNETPGLGTKIEEIDSKKTWHTVLTGTSPDESGLRPWFQLQFEGESAPVKIDKDGGPVEAITGATISSRAVCEAVNRAVENLKSAVGD